jgi:hypothetical protein
MQYEREMEREGILLPVVWHISCMLLGLFLYSGHLDAVFQLYMKRRKIVVGSGNFYYNTKQI